MRFAYPLSAMTAAAVLFGAAASAAPVGLALGNNGQTLVRLSDVAGTAMLSGQAIRDASGNAVTIEDLDWRPATGEIFGYSDADDAVYRIDRTTAVATRIVERPGLTGVPTTGFDFNNNIDAARIVSTEEDNFVFFPERAGPPAEAARIAGNGFGSGIEPLAYAMGDPNFGRDPSVFANAYVNAVAATQGGPTPPTQYILDSQWDLLGTLGNNTGQLSTIGGVFVGDDPLDFTENGGFDIFSTAVGDNTAYALLNTATGVGLYSLALMADMDGRVQANLIQSFGGQFGVLDGLTVFDDPQPVPVPAAIWLLGGALGGLAFLRRRRANA